MELHGFDLAVSNGMDRNGGTGLVLHGADITDDVIGNQILGADHAAQIQGVDDTIRLPVIDIYELISY